VFEPVSSIDYKLLNPRGQILVVCCPVGEQRHDVLIKWKDKACAVVGDSGTHLRDVVRDVLANPQIRAIVFYGLCCGKDAYDKLWAGENPPGWNIDGEHTDLVRNFVDIFIDDVNFNHPQAPFYPSRIKYLE
jgi:hypothetical protein